MKTPIIKYKILITDDIHDDICANYYAVKETFTETETRLFDAMKHEMYGVNIAMTTITAYYIASLFFNSKTVREHWDVHKYRDLKKSLKIMEIVDMNKNTLRIE